MKSIWAMCGSLIKSRLLCFNDSAYNARKIESKYIIVYYLSNEVMDVKINKIRRYQQVVK